MDTDQVWDGTVWFSSLCPAVLIFYTQLVGGVGHPAEAFVFCCATAIKEILYPFSETIGVRFFYILLIDGSCVKSVFILGCPLLLSKQRGVKRYCQWLRLQAPECCQQRNSAVWLNRRRTHYGSSGSFSGMWPNAWPLTNVLTSSASLLTLMRQVRMHSERNAHSGMSIVWQSGF